MNGGQIGILVLLGMNVGLHLAKHGEPKEGKYNFGAALVANLIEVGLLYWGGFWA